MSEQVWKDKTGKLYTLKDIDDRYLLNIIRFLGNGGGHHMYLDEKKIKKIYKEAIKRNIEVDVSLEALISIHKDIKERMILAECFAWDDMLWG